jgi:hypothetical protein
VTQLNLSRMEVEEAGPNPVRLADAIHGQLGPRPGRIEVYAIAKALDIVEIREEPLEGFEAALITFPERSFGSILVNLLSSPQRRRFSAGHELLHFLNLWHEPTSSDGFQCSRQDMLVTKAASTNRHRRQEAEANEFAIELFAPPPRVAPFIDSDAHLKHALAMAAELDISREAAARRFVALHEERLAIVFAHKGFVRYAESNTEFPRLAVSKDAPIPYLPRYSRSGTLSEFEEVDPVDWLRRPVGADLSAQILRQRDDRAIILLKAQPNDAEDGDLEDVFDRFARAGSRS